VSMFQWTIVVVQCLNACVLRTIVCSCGASWLPDCVENRVEEAGCQACEQLSPGERVYWKWCSPRESPAPATEL
jgi:hypothetical protein